jgi:hypothetical protein
MRKAGWRRRRITVYPRRILGYCRRSRRVRSVALSNTRRGNNKGCRRGLASIFDVEVVRIWRGCERNTTFFDGL